MSRLHILAGAASLSVSKPYPEKAEAHLAWADKAAEWLLAHVWRPLAAHGQDLPVFQQKIVTATLQYEAEFAGLTDEALRLRVGTLRGALRRSGFVLAVVGECFALIREAAARTLGLRHYPSQLIGGWGLLQGKLIEMATGEGKTLVATLPAAVVAMAGYPAHVITVNDYLAERDAAKMRPLYQFLGLSVGVVLAGMEKNARREAYAQAITYCTNKELAFDYLRDSTLLQQRSSDLHLALEQLRGEAQRQQELVLRGLYFAVVDEADSVFIDEARTPLILSVSTQDKSAAENSRLALALAAEMVVERDYRLELRERRLNLTEAGRQQLAQTVESLALSGVWSSLRAQQELIEQALSALHLYQRDVHYLVADNKIQIIDESTGRVMADRSWERGLHQMIEVKENCEVTARRETLARLTYQRLFRRYMRLSGMTGTAAEVRAEIRHSYRLAVSKIPLNRPSKRIYVAPTLCLTRAEKWQRVADRVQTLIAQQRPVLIGTRSVQASEEISLVLQQRGITHALLNAKQDADEAGVIAAAGGMAKVTVATNMAGRGTDILLDDGVEALGGLHVILSEFHESRRVDRQLFGRCARQGDAGSCEAIVSLEDELFGLYAPRWTKLVQQYQRQKGVLPSRMIELLRARAQAQAEAQARQIRVSTIKQDEKVQQLLAFTGQGE